MKKTESPAHTFKVAFVLCLVCSICVALAAVLLRPLQNANKELDKRKNILIAAGLYDEKAGAIIESGGLTKDTPIRDIFPSQKPDGSNRIWIETRIIDLATGKEIDDKSKENIDKKFGEGKYDQRKASRDTSGVWSDPIPGENDVAGVKRREKYGTVYIVRKADGSRDQIVLPIRGYGLWSTLWGFLSLDADLVTVRGLTYYEHGETPGLGGEVDNLSWKEKWKGKLAFGEQGKVNIRVIKGRVSEKAADAAHQIDGLSGATITSRGVSNMMRYWLGKHGYRPLLDRMRKQKNE